jgi:DGQHR domain-containing protein
VFRRADPTVLRVNALRVEQRPDVPLFVFGIDGRLVHQFASVQFAEREGSGELLGYQRSRVERHIREIRDYLLQDNALLPNAIVVAFDGSATFSPLEGELKVEWGTLGKLTIPMPPPGSPKPALIVDGQQRMSALAELKPEHTLPIIVVGFSSASEELQREQFLLVNKTKPLPRDLLNELVARVDTALPKAWRLRRVAALVVESLRYDKSSPFYGRIRGIGATGEGANISQAAVLDVIEQSVRKAGVLSAYYSPALDQADVATMEKIVSVYFHGVERVWPAAWHGSPWSSRLVHGVGISSLGRLMDVVMSEVDASKPRALMSVERRLRRIKSRCAWTEGRWPVLRCAWNELQNTSQDKRRLAEYLVQEYRRRSK